MTDRSLGCHRLEGWACIVGQQAPLSIKVERLVEGGGYELFTSFSADQQHPNPDVADYLSAACRTDGKHAFFWDVPSSMRDGNTYTMRVLFEDTRDTPPAWKVIVAESEIHCPLVTPTPTPSPTPTPKDGDDDDQPPGDDVTGGGSIFNQARVKLSK